MPKRTDISSILVIGAGHFAPSHPLGGEGWGEGGVPWFGARRPSGVNSPRSRLRYARHPLPLKGVRVSGVGIASQLDQYRADHPVDIPHHVGIGKAYDAIAARLKRSGAGGIIGLCRGVTVPIQFDYQSRRPCREISDMRTDGELPGELDTKLLAAKPRPEVLFRVGHCVAQFLGAGAGDRVSLGHDAVAAPSPNPLPLKGERAIPISRKAGNAQKN